MKSLLVRGQYYRPTASRGEHNVCVDDVGGFGPGHQRSYLMRFFTCEGHDVATAKEPPQLHLAWRPAHLGDYRPCCHWNNTQFEAGAVVSPDFAVVSVGSDQETCVVDDAHAERRLLEPRISSATRSPRRSQLGVRQGAVLSLPFGHRGQTITQEKSPARCGRHPCGNAQPLLGGRGQNPLMDLRVDGDRQLR